MGFNADGDPCAVARDSNKPTGYPLPDYWILPLRDNTGLWWLDHEIYVERVCEIVKSSGARTVLEAGCGDGWNCHKLVDRGLEVVGCDWSQNGIDFARHLVPDAKFYCRDLTATDFQQTFSKSFDAVVLIEVIEHIRPDECSTVLANILRFLRTGGIFVLTTPSVNQVNQNPQHYRHFTESTLRALMASIPGMEVVAVEGYGDAVFERKYHTIMRWFDNRLFRIKPLKTWLDQLYLRKYARQSPVDRSRGLIMTAIKRDIPSGARE